MNTFSLTSYKHFLTSPKKKIIAGTALGVAMIAGLLTGLATSRVDAADSKVDSNIEIVVTQLNKLQTQLASLEEATKKPFPDVDFTAITQQINALSARIDQLKPVDTEQLTQTITQSESSLGNQLDQIKAVVNHLDAQQTPVTYLPVNALPFKVVSVDSIQQTSIASVAYDYKTVPLEKGDSLAGWKIVVIDYGKQRLELENSKKERVVITESALG